VPGTVVTPVTPARSPRDLSPWNVAIFDANHHRVVADPPRIGQRWNDGARHLRSTGMAQKFRSPRGRAAL